MQRLIMILVAAATLVAICGCQKEIKEIRAPQHDGPALASATIAR